MKKNNYYIDLNGTRINLNKHKEFHEFLPNEDVLEEHIKAQIVNYRNEKEAEVFEEVGLGKKFVLEPMELTVTIEKYNKICSLLVSKSGQRDLYYINKYASLSIYNSKFRFSVLKIIKGDD